MGVVLSQNKSKLDPFYAALRIWGVLVPSAAGEGVASFYNVTLPSFSRLDSVAIGGFFLRIFTYT